MWSRKRIDIGWADMLFGFWQVGFPPDRGEVARGVEAMWPDAENTLACLSVRSGFDLVALLDGNVFCPGAEVSPHTYWVFPVFTGRADRLLERLSRAGFDATQGQSLCVVGCDGESSNAATPAAEKLLAEVVFLPFYAELPRSELRRMAGVVLGCD